MRSCWLAAFALVTLGCGSNDESEPQKPASSVLLYGPVGESELTFYPSDRYTVADSSTPTGLRVHIDDATDPLASAYPVTTAELDELDGFSTIGGVILKFSAPLDPSGIVLRPDADPPVLDPVRDAGDYTKSDSPLFLVDVDAASPNHGTALGIVPIYYEQPKDVDYDTDEFTLIAQPATPLRPGTRYALMASTALHAYDGTTVGRTKDMTSALSSSKDGYALELQAAVDEATTAVGIAKSDVVAATVFTTASSQRGVIEMAKARRAAPPPAQGDPFTIETAYAAPNPRVRFRASYETPEFRKDKPDGKWELDASGAPVVQKTVPLELFLAFSDATKSGPRPVVIFQHGLGGDKDGCWGTSERLAAIDPNGAAVIAIDSPEHGSRGSANGLVQSVYGFFGIDPDTNDFDIGRARDNFRQMASDQLELVRFIETLGNLDLLPLDANGQPAPDGKPDLDLSRIYYIGHSFGSVQGATVFALAPEITRATWNVGGAGLMMLLRDSQLFSIVVHSLTPPRTPFGAVARFMAVTQAIVDPGDPLNFGRNATLEPLDGVPGWSGRDVLLQEVKNDNTVPNSTSEALARAAGLGILNDLTDPLGLESVSAPVSGNLPTGGSGVVCQFDTMEGGKAATHGELIFSPEAQAQYVAFFQGSGHGSVKAPY
jgi:pimeloyl-ACP methyl ester carboxylesterase